MLKPISMKEATRIAKEFVPLTTLEPRNRDSLDFYSVGVRSLHRMLDEAYKAGQKAERNKYRF